MVKIKRKTMLSVILPLTLGMVLFAGGCKEEENHEIVVEEKPAQSEYLLAEAEKGDVVLTKKVTLKYAQKDSENLNFKLEGYQIKGVYVEKGDKVKKGDLLAELNMEEAGEEYEKCLSTIEIYETSLNFLIEQKDLALDQSKRMLASGEIDEAGALERNKKIEEEYEPQIKEYRDLIEYETLRKEYYGGQVEEGRIYAGIDGTVAFVRSFSSTARSIKTQNVVTIFDSAKCSFICAGEEYAEYMHDGMKCTIELLNGTPYDTVYRFSPEEGELVFELEEPDYTLSIGTKAYYYIVLDERKDVLRVPKKAVHHAGDDYYVYYTDENNIRTVQYVEVGLEGNDYTEIISGINEGDFLVLK
ncbi:MAG: biotin/lipoyl-binding protein [Lachnospiraceae bacterium]|nr:biotin/lipoyl-binding protein [Lachnospiraceae bacterium]